MKDSLVLIPARKGSKGIKKKNIKEFVNQPLIKYTIDFAKANFATEDICLSSDSDEIIDYVRGLGVVVDFKRPEALAKDSSGTREVILHALQFYAERGKNYKYVVLLQPTSPVRSANLISEADRIMNDGDDFDLIVAVKEAKSNPYFNLFEEMSTGYLKKSKEGGYIRRQDSPKVYEYTGAFYVIKVSSLFQKEIADFEKIRKILIDSPLENIDLDTPLDWEIGEFLLKTSTPANRSIIR